MVFSFSNIAIIFCQRQANITFHLWLLAKKRIVCACFNFMNGSYRDSNSQQAYLVRFFTGKVGWWSHPPHQIALKRLKLSTLGISREVSEHPWFAVYGIKLSPTKNTAWTLSLSARWTSSILLSRFLVLRKSLFDGMELRGKIETNHKWFKQRRRES